MVSNSLKESLNKLNKTKVIKSMIRGFQKPLGPGGIKGLKKKGYESDSNNTP
mgnify:CR=1 FL=1